jgi:hypothetical protein
MIPTVEDAAQFAAALLGDSIREDYTDGRLLPYIQSWYRRMFSDLALHGVPASERKVFYLLPAYTNVLKITTLGVNDMGEPQSVQERHNDGSVAITATDTASPITVTTASAHGKPVGSRVLIYGVQGQAGANGEYYLTAVPAATQATLGGSVSEAAWTSGGTMMWAAEQFMDLDYRDNLEEREPSVMLQNYEWSGDAFRFIPSTEDRQLRISYFTTGTAPSTGSLLVDDCLNAIGYGAAAAVGKIDGLSESADWDQEAKVALHRLVQMQVKKMQADEDRQPPPFADRRILEDRYAR